MSDPSLQALGLGVELAGRRIIDGVSLVAHNGQTVAVVGPNGAGKTTLLRALAGLIPSSGELRLAEHDPRRRSAQDAAATRAYCAQKPVCAWDYQVSDLGEIVGNPADFVSWLERLRLSEHVDRRLSALSGGEQKGAHLAMAFAALTEPFGGLLLLDEPAAALDLARQEVVRQAILSFAQAGATCVIATHDLGFARGCDQVIVLSEGRMMASGRPMDALTPEIVASVWGQASSPSR